MKSLYLAIVFAMIVILAIAVFVFLAITQSMVDSYFNPVFDNMDEVEVQEAAEMLQTSGPAAVAAYMHRLDSVFGGSHYLLDSVGTDLLTGADRSEWLPEAPLVKSRGAKGGYAFVTHRSKDGRFWFVAVSQLKPEKSNLYHLLATAPLRSGNAPLYQYYLLVVGSSVVLCWLAAVYLVSPIRRIATGIRRFGEGDLSVRLPVQRSDEIGTLAKAFNSMADRIQTLFLSEQRLLADVSHELRSPLARLHFSVKLARSAHDRDAALDRIKRDVDRLSSLVASLVEMARAEGGSPDCVFEGVRLGKLVAETIGDCDVELHSNGSRICYADKAEIVVDGNTELLRRAIENVLRNAIRHSPQGGEIDVDLRLMERTAIVSIRDHGQGLPETFLERIFDPFFRAEEARDSDSGGVGLGLSIAKRAVQIHRGAIRARNANPGLCVEIELPISATAVQRRYNSFTSGVIQN